MRSFDPSGDETRDSWLLMRLLLMLLALLEPKLLEPLQTLVIKMRRKEWIATEDIPFFCSIPERKNTNEDLNR